MTYRVVIVSSECCSPLSNDKIEKACNQMSGSGFVLVVGFPDNVQSCGGGKRGVILVFARP
jgi:hypothetical protein